MSKETIHSITPSRSLLRNKKCDKCKKHYDSLKTLVTIDWFFEHNVQELCNDCYQYESKTKARKRYEKWVIWMCDLWKYKE